MAPRTDPSEGNGKRTKPGKRLALYSIDVVALKQAVPKLQPVEQFGCQEDCTFAWGGFPRIARRLAFLAVVQPVQKTYQEDPKESAFSSPNDPIEQDAGWMWGTFTALQRLRNSQTAAI